MVLGPWTGIWLSELVSEKLRDLVLIEAEARQSFSANQQKNMSYVFDKFSDFIIPTEVMLIIQSSTFDNVELIEGEIKKLKKINFLKIDGLSMKDLVVACGGISKTQYRMRMIEKNLRVSRGWLLNEPDFSDQFETQKNILSYIKGLVDSLTLINVFIERKRYKSQSVYSDFCVFCWKLVRHNQYAVNDFEKEDRPPVESRHYCPEHHSARSRSSYNRALRALMKAVKDEKPEFKSDIVKIESKNISISSRCSAYEMFTESFAKKIKFTQLNIKSTHWCEMANVLLLEVKSHYKYLPKKINSPVESYNSWSDWFFYGVLDKLDTSHDKSERVMWEYLDSKFNGLGWNISTFSKNSVLILLKIFRRYEAYQYVMNRKRPRGPKSNLFKKDTELQIKVKTILLEHLNAGRNITGEEVATLAGTTAPTVSRIKKSMGLSKPKP